jgi:DNA-binding transcriptional LysR family regulator
LKARLRVLNGGGTGPVQVLTAPSSRLKSFIRSPLKMRQLAFIVRLHDERNLARAAAGMGFAQPQASKLLRQLETCLGVKLFERHARGVEPTRYGEILVRHARQAVSALGTAREEIAALKSGLSGKTTIGSIVNPGTKLVPAAINRMKQHYPGVLISVEIDPSKQLVERLLEGHFDLVVGRVLDPTLASELVYESLAPDEPHAIIASATHPLAGCKGLQLEDLIDLPWILPPPGSLVRDRFIALCAQQGLPLPTNIVETLALPAVTGLLQHSKMVVPLPEEVVQPYCDAGILSVLVKDIPLGVGAFGLITRRNHPLSPGAQLMLNTLREMAGQIYPEASRSVASPDRHH